MITSNFERQHGGKIAMLLYGAWLTFGLAVSGCTDNQMARDGGGTATMTNPEPSKYVLISASWKNDSLWVLWYDPAQNECIYKEKSAYGAFEGTYKIEQCNVAGIKAK